MKLIVITLLRFYGTLFLIKILASTWTARQRDPDQPRNDDYEWRGAIYYDPDEPAFSLWAKIPASIVLLSVIWWVGGNLGLIGAILCLIVVFGALANKK
jgi:hypothetical protein